jgi:hypothetical protein
MKIIVKNGNDNLFMNNCKIFYLKQNIKIINRKNFMRNNLFVNLYNNCLLLFKNYYYNNFTFNNLIINQINLYTLLNGNNNCYLVIKNTNFEYIYNLTYKMVLSVIIKRGVKIFFTNKVIVYINLLVCLTEKFVNKI